MYHFTMSGIQDEVRYQVFVSSTFADLKDERAKVLQAILECKAFPAGMELFPSADDEQFEFIKREIDSSDYYIVIVAGRYGSLADDGISFTEKEFDYALTQGKPILAFLIKDPKKLMVDKCEVEKKRTAKLEKFKRKASKSRLVNYYDNPDELKSQVLHSINSQFRINPKRGWIPAGLSKREDLEDIRNLQNKVILLEAENTELKSQREDATARLGQGRDPVSLEVNMEALAASFSKGLTGTEVRMPSDTTQLNTDWDELLSALYPSGSSLLDSDDVERKLLLLFSRKIPDPKLRNQWFNIALHNLIAKNLDLFSFWQAKADIYRQFTGLGLIEEIVENRYKEPVPDYVGPTSIAYIGMGGGLPQAKSDPIPIRLIVWKLTRRGEEQLALIRGFRKDGSP